MSRVPQFWIAFSSVANCETSFRRCIWGLRKSQEFKWEQLSENRDRVLFYVGRPVSGVVACGTILKKYYDEVPEWPEERSERKAIWPFRFHFSFDLSIQPPFWRQQKILVDELEDYRVGGFQKLPAQVAEKLLGFFPATAVSDNLRKVEPSFRKTGRPDITGQHDQGKSWLMEIGRLQSFIAEAEYPVLTKRVDVVWKRMELSVPSHVFEVQVGGNLTDALGKLKQAHDLWNSRILLVGGHDHRAPFKQLANGAFREIGKHVKFIELGHVEELLSKKRAYRDLETDLGILG